MRLLNLCLLLALFFFSATDVGAQQTMTLDECLNKGLKNNTTLQASRYRLEESSQDVKIARADFLPSLSSSFSANRLGAISSKGPTDTDYLNQYIHSTNVKLSQIIYAGSRISNAYQKAHLIEQASQAATKLTQLELAYNIQSTFFKVMKAKQDVITTAEAVARLHKNVQVADAFFAKQLIPYVDVLAAKVDLADAESNQGVAQNEENRQRMELFTLMNLPFDPNVAFTDSSVFTLSTPPSFDDCFHYALEHRPDLRSLELQRQASLKDAAIAKAKYLPVVKLEGNYVDSTRDYEALGDTGTYTYDRDQRNRYWTVGITATWDLFDGGKGWYQSEQAEIKSRRLVSMHQEAQNTIANGIRKAIFSMAEAKQRLSESNKALAAAQENYAAEENRLKAGLSPLTDLLDAESRLLRAQANVSTATLDHRLATAELAFMTGGYNFLP